MTETPDIDALNGYLRAEMAAVETYQQAADQLDDEPSLEKILGNCRDSHQQRVEWLRSAILALGGEPAKRLGATGKLAKLTERGAASFGTKAAMKALEEGEARGLRHYEEAVAASSSKLSTDDLRRFVELRLLPEQRNTHATLTQVTSHL